MEKTYFLTSKNKNQYLMTIMSITIIGIAGIYLVLWFSNVISQGPIIAILPIGFAIYQIVYMVNYYNNKHIAVNDTGIKYNTPRIAFHAKWQDLEKISIGWHEQRKQEGLIVDKLKLETKNSIQKIPSMHYFPSQSAKAFIPLSCFAENWRDSALGQQIKQHAPHLFEK